MKEVSSIPARQNTTGYKHHGKKKKKQQHIWRGTPLIKYVYYIYVLPIYHIRLVISFFLH